MISYLTRDALDVKKYDDCISNARNCRIYAFSWYLDVVAKEDWDVLILDDYVAVMPLPRRRKYFIHYIYLVSWSQQLGIFSSHPVSSNLVQQFISAIPSKFKLIDIFFNSENKFDDVKVRRRTNYLLSLNASYETLFKNFSKGRKSNVKQASNYNLTISKIHDYSAIISLFKANKDEKVLENDSDYDILNDLMLRGTSFNMVESLGVVTSKNELIGGAFFFKDRKRITYLFSAMNVEGRDKQAMSFILNYVIAQNADTHYTLDFEGSMIPNIASFCKSFGAVKETYYHYKKYVLFG